MLISESRFINLSRSDSHVAGGRFVVRRKASGAPRSDRPSAMPPALAQCQKPPLVQEQGNNPERPSTMSPTRRTDQRRQAFTLIELLVVIAIIAILIGLL